MTFCYLSLILLRLELKQLFCYAFMFMRVISIWILVEKGLMFSFTLLSLSFLTGSLTFIFIFWSSFELLAFGPMKNLSPLTFRHLMSG